MADAISVPFLPGGQDHFGIGLGGKTVAAPLQLLAQLTEVEDLAVEDQAEILVGAQHGLAAGD